MGTPKHAHGFTDVDGQDDPGRWATLLDTIAGDPFYAGLKRRIAVLLQPRPGGRYLDAGAGTGAAAAALAAEVGDAGVVALDSSYTMASAARAGGLRWVLRADAHRLPFAAGTFAGVSADRVLQHVVDPRRVAAELVRVTAPGGRVVLCDPDYDTQVLDIADADLARRVLRFRAEHLLRNGTYAHRHGGLLADLGLVGVRVEAYTLVIRDPTAVDNVMGLRSWAGTAAKLGELTAAEAAEFQAQFDRSVACGHFTYAVTFFLTAGGRPH